MAKLGFDVCHYPYMEWRGRYFLLWCKMGHFRQSWKGCVSHDWWFISHLHNQRMFTVNDLDYGPHWTKFGNMMALEICHFSSNLSMFLLHFLCVCVCVCVCFSVCASLNKVLSFQLPQCMFVYGIEPPPSISTVSTKFYHFSLNGNIFTGVSTTVHVPL